MAENQKRAEELADEIMYGDFQGTDDVGGTYWRNTEALIALIKEYLDGKR